MDTNRVLRIVLLLLALSIRDIKSDTWYEKSFYLLHEDHHTHGDWKVGRDADPAETARRIRLSRPDVIQIHAKGNPGWTTYPSDAGHTPPNLERDVLGLWRAIARRDGYRFSAYYNIGRDGEIMERHPEWNRAKADGRLYERALCYHTGAAENYLWPMIDEILERYAPDGFWFDGSCFTVAACYCEKCTERYRREQGRAPPLTAKARDWPAFQEMHRRIYREFVGATARRIKRRDPDCLVAFNWAYSLRMPEKPDPAIDYLTGDIANDVDGLSAEAHWYDGQDRPFDLMTTVHLRHGKTVEPKPPEQIRQEMAVIIANGGRYFAWDAPTPTSGLREEVHEFLGKTVAPFLRERQTWCLGTRRVADVSLLHAATNHYAVLSRQRQSFPRPQYLHAPTEALCRLHLNYEMVSEARLERGDLGSQLLVVENPNALREKSTEAIAQFVSDGGNVLMTGGGLEFGDLPEVFGLETGQSTGEPGDLSVSVESETVRFRHALHRVQLEGARAILSATDGAGDSHPLLTEHRFGKGRAWFVAAPLLTPPEGGEVPARLQAFVFDRILPARERNVTTDAPASVEVVLRKQGDDRRVLHLVNRSAGNREVVRTQWGRPYHRITGIPEVPSCPVSLRLAAKPGSVRLQPQGIDLDNWTYENGRLELDVPGFHIHQMVVIEGR